MSILSSPQLYYSREEFIKLQDNKRACEKSAETQDLQRPFEDLMSHVGEDGDTMSQSVMKISSSAKAHGAASEVHAEKKFVYRR